jgi:hypothetical protein
VLQPDCVTQQTSACMLVQATRELQQKVEYLEAELAQQEDMQDKYRWVAPRGSKTCSAVCEKQQQQCLGLSDS